MSALLEMRNVQAAYGHAQALFGMGFEVQPGEVVTLLGRNGMGRSTTVKCLFGLLPVKGGTIALRGERTNGLPSYRVARRGLALVPEGRQVFSNLTVEENLVATARKGIGSSEKWTL